MGCRASATGGSGTSRTSASSSGLSSSTVGRSRRAGIGGWSNEVTAAVKSVHADNLVVAGGTAPFRDIAREVQKVNPRWGPLTFMRELLCLSYSLKPKCKQRIVSIWAHRRSTPGGPTRHADLPAISRSATPEMWRVLSPGVRVGSVASRTPPRSPTRYVCPRSARGVYPVLPAPSSPLNGSACRTATRVGPEAP